MSVTRGSRDAARLHGRPTSRTSSQRASRSVLPTTADPLAGEVLLVKFRLQPWPEIGRSGVLGAGVGTGPARQPSWRGPSQRTGGVPCRGRPPENPSCPITVWKSKKLTVQKMKDALSHRTRPRARPPRRPPRPLGRALTCSVVSPISGQGCVGNSGLAGCRSSARPPNLANKLPTRFEECIANDGGPTRW